MEALLGPVRSKEADNQPFTLNVGGASAPRLKRGFAGDGRGAEAPPTFGMLCLELNPDRCPPDGIRRSAVFLRKRAGELGGKL